MRLKNFLKEQDGGATPGGEGFVDAGTGTTTKNIEPFISKIGTAPVSRFKKKKKKRIFYNESKDNFIMDIYDVLSNNTLNESLVPDFIFNNIKSVGDKIGFKIKRSDTLFNYIGYAEREIVELFNLVCLYIIAGPTDKSSLKSEIKKSVSGINRKRLVAFFIQADKLTLGLVAFVGKIIQNITGVEITSYNKWVSNIEYIIVHLDDVKSVLDTMNPTPEEISAFDNLYNLILKTKKEVEDIKK